MSLTFSRFLHALQQVALLAVARSHYSATSISLLPQSSFYDDTYRGYLETDVKFQIWPFNTYRGYLETDSKYQHVITTVQYVPNSYSDH